jgi:hypothetical protein
MIKDSTGHAGQERATQGVSIRSSYRKETFPASDGVAIDIEHGYGEREAFRARAAFSEDN